MTWLITLLVGCLSLHQAQAQTTSTTEDVPARIAAAREALSRQKQSIEAEHDERQRACWQRFAVNDCLREVRRSRHAALDPLRPLELALNEQERAWRTQQREERLRGKQDVVQKP